MNRRTLIAIGLTSVSAALLPLGGCSAFAPTTQSAANQKQAAILANPGGYDPGVHQDLSNGNLGSDLHDVFFP